MKISVIIIGFKYDKQEIHCVLYDIFRIYKYFNSRNYSCYIMTDIQDFTYTIGMYDCIRKNQISEDFTDFIGEIRYYPSWYKKVNNRESLEEAINTLDKSDICIAYYSGHGTKRGIQLPSSEVMNYVHFRNILIPKASEELIMVMDCCNSSSMNLPYYMNDTCKLFKANANREYLALDILVITSSDSDQKSLANDYTSLFTKYFLEFLTNDDQRSFSSMIEYIQTNTLGHDVGKQNIMVYSSAARHPIIPNYLFGRYHIKLNIADNYLIFEKL